MDFTRIPNESKIHFGIHIKYIKIAQCDVAIVNGTMFLFTVTSAIKIVSAAGAKLLLLRHREEHKATRDLDGEFSVAIGSWQA